MGDGRYEEGNEQHEDEDEDEVEDRRSDEVDGNMEEMEMKIFRMERAERAKTGDRETCSAVAEEF